MPHKVAFKVYWDNGNHACGTFPQEFKSRGEAEAFAETWARERNLEDLGMTDAEVEACGGEGCYTAEAIEAEDAPDIDEYDQEHD